MRSTSGTSNQSAIKKKLYRMAETRIPTLSRAQRRSCVSCSNCRSSAAGNAIVRLRFSMKASTVSIETDKSVSLVTLQGISMQPRCFPRNFGTKLTISLPCKREWSIEGFCRGDQAEKGGHRKQCRQATFTDGHGF